MWHSIVLLLVILPTYANDSFNQHWIGRTIYLNLPTKTQASTQLDNTKAILRQQYVKTFHDLQVQGQGLLRDHESRLLTPKRLAKSVKSINKSAKTLRSLMALGDLAKETKIDKAIYTPVKFDESIRKLVKLISDFAHNPVHQSNKVFNTDQAARAQTDLLTIINLSKVIENMSKSYVFSSSPAQ